MLDLLLTNNKSLIHSVKGAETTYSISHHKIIEVDTQYQCKYSVKSSRDQDDDYLSPFNEHNFHSEETDWDAYHKEAR